MEEKQFKGFEEIIVKDGLWSFKGKNTWSRDIVELMKWINISRRIEHKNKNPIFDISFDADSLD